jgi:putative MATE family efflux protein
MLARVSKDLTQGSIARHIVRLSIPIAAGMIVPLLYQIVDLYFVSGIGDVAVAGVSAAGNMTFIVTALTQALGLGTVALIRQASARRDRAEADLVFNQSLVLSGLCAVLVLVAGYLLARPYLLWVAADGATVEAGVSYLFWLMPGMSLQFALISMGSALQGTGIAKPTMLVQLSTVVINIALAPILIAGWGTGHPLGVAGAGLATSIAVSTGVAMLWLYFHRLEHFVALDRGLARPQWKQWKRMLQLGLPSGGEFALIFIYGAITYYAIRNFGAAAQAGFGIGSRVLQAIMLPAVAIAFAAGPIAHQNYGAGNPARVRETFRRGVIIGSIAMTVVTLVVQWRPQSLIGLFTREPQVLSVGVLFLRLISVNIADQGLIFTCSSMFEGLGNTTASLLSLCTRLVTYAVPAIWLSHRPNFRIDYVCYLLIATVALQAPVSFWLMRRELKKRLAPFAAAAAPSLSSPRLASVGDVDSTAIDRERQQNIDAVATSARGAIEPGHGVKHAASDRGPHSIDAPARLA